MLQPFACAILNGSQVIRCGLPDKATVATAGPQEGLDEEVVKGGLCGDDLELSVLFYSPNAVPQDNTKWAGVLLCHPSDSQQEPTPLYLGDIKSRREVRTTHHLLPFFPAAVSLEVSQGPLNPEKQTFSEAEIAFVEHVRNILEDPVVNPRRGSLQLSTVEKVAENSQHYKEVMQGLYNGSWCHFVLGHAEYFTLFNYTTQEIVGRGMENYVDPYELRIVLKKDRRLQFQSESEETEIVEFLKNILKERDLTADEVLTEIHNAGLGYSVAPAFSQLMRFLGRNKQLFSWSTNPSQVTMIGLANLRRNNAGPVDADDLHYGGHPKGWAHIPSEADGRSGMHPVEPQG